MRAARLVGSLALSLALVGSAPAQPTSFRATVVVPEAEVRSGPSQGMYATARLRQGQAVDVVQVRDDGWLAVKPPPGSFSWVPARLLEERPHHVWVVLTQTQPLVGSLLRAERPTVQGPALPRGTILYGAGGRMTDADGEWLSIEPAPGEVRYVRAADVERANGTATARTEAPAAAPAPAGDAPRSHPLWARAQEARAAGRLDEAIGLLDRLGQELAGTSHAQAMVCHNEAARLRQARVSAGISTGAMTPRYGDACPAPKPSAGPAAVRTSYPAGDSTLPAPAVPAGPPNLSLGPPCTSPTLALTPGSLSQPGCGPAAVWSGAGKLRRSGYRLDARPTYVLETPSGQTLMYVTAQPGLDLAPYVGWLVDLHGPLHYRGDIRANFMAAGAVVRSP